MCHVCGCDSHDTHEHVHADGTRHRHAHAGEHVHLEARILAKNDGLAARNRAWLGERKVVALNLMGAPGCGKTSLLERSIRDLRGSAPVLVLEGDQATANDAERVRAAGAAVVQINTGTGCHLDASMVAKGLVELDPPAGALVVIENVGNLVCPALFDLGETRRVVVLSVTEGDDKPLKYPHMFRAADLVILSKTDLLPHVEFDPQRAARHARELNPAVEVIELSARRGAGLQAWYAWLQKDSLTAVSGPSSVQSTPAGSKLSLA